MTEKRCTNCKYTRGIGFDFWCGEGHTEYEVIGAETNCPYYEYHDWSKGIPSKTEKRFTLIDMNNIEKVLPSPIKDNESDCLTCFEVVDLLNELHEENHKIKSLLLKKVEELNDAYDKSARAGMPTGGIIGELDSFEELCRVMGWIE